MRIETAVDEENPGHAVAMKAEIGGANGAPLAKGRDGGGAGVEPIQQGADLAVLLDQVEARGDDQRTGLVERAAEEVAECRRRLGNGRRHVPCVGDELGMGLPAKARLAEGDEEVVVAGGGPRHAQFTATLEQLLMRPGGALGLRQEGVVEDTAWRCNAVERPRVDFHRGPIGASGLQGSPPDCPRSVRLRH